VAVVVEMVVVAVVLAVLELALVCQYQVALNIRLPLEQVALPKLLAAILFLADLHLMVVAEVAAGIIAHYLHLVVLAVAEEL
jgi:hypothetical protein